MFFRLSEKRKTAPLKTKAQIYSTQKIKHSHWLKIVTRH